MNFEALFAPRRRPDCRFYGAGGCGHPAVAHLGRTYLFKAQDRPECVLRIHDDRLTHCALRSPLIAPVPEPPPPPPKRAL